MAPRLCVAVGAERLLLKALPVEMPHWRLPVAIITVKNQLSPVAKLFIDCAREVANPLAKKLHTHSGGWPIALIRDGTKAAIPCSAAWWSCDFDIPWDGRRSRATCRNKPATTQRKLFLSAERANYRFFFFAKITFQFSL
jgi:hypothetical protein